MAADLTTVQRQARKAGWTVEQTGGNHLRWTCPCGGFHVTPLSPRTMKWSYAVRKHLALPKGHADPTKENRHRATAH